MPNDSPDWAALTDVAPLLLGTLQVDASGIFADQFYNLPATTTGLRIEFDASAGTARVIVLGGVTAATYVDVTLPDLFHPPPVYAEVQGNGEIQAEVRVTFSINQGAAGTVVGRVYALGASGYQVVQSPPAQPLVVTGVPGPGITAPSAFEADALAATNGGFVVVIPAVAGKTVTVYGWDVSVYSVTAAHTARGYFGGSATLTRVLRVGSETITAVGVVGAPHCLWLPTAIRLQPGEGLNFTADAGLTNDCIIDGVFFATQN